MSYQQPVHLDRVEALIMATEEAAERSADEHAEAGKARSRRSRGHVTIFGTWCKGCGLCVAFCPQGVFAAHGDGRPLVVCPERCTACHWCDTHCPDLAITVRRLEPEEAEELAEVAGQGALPAGGDL